MKNKLDVKWKSSLAALFIVIFLGNSINAQTNKRQGAFPQSSPEQQGMSSKILDSLMNFIKNTKQDIHQLTIIRNGQTILSADFYPYSSSYVHDLASVTKSVTSLLIGIAIDKGYIKSEDDTVMKYFPEIKNENPYLKLLTVKDLLIMSSGFECDENSLKEMREGKDWINYIFKMPFSAKPGGNFNYCSCNFYLLAEILTRATNMKPHEFAKKFLFKPLDITDSKWIANYKGVNHGWGDLFLSPEDMAKIGSVMLNEGSWRNRHVVSSTWVHKSVHTYVSTENAGKGYGYGWWTDEKAGYFEAAGRGRQAISVVPSKNIIVTMLGSEFDAGTIGSYIFKAIQSDSRLREDTVAFASLRAAAFHSGAAPKINVLLINAKLVQRLDHKVIVLGKNILGIDSLSFSFNPSGNGEVYFFKNSTREFYPFVSSESNYKISIDENLHLPVALQVFSKGSDTLILHYNQLNRINNIYFSFQLSDAFLNLNIEETSNFIKTDIPAQLK